MKRGSGLVMALLLGGSLAAGGADLGRSSPVAIPSDAMAGGHRTAEWELGELDRVGPSAVDLSGGLVDLSGRADVGSSDADFDGDGFADLAVGGGLRDVDGDDDGVVVVVYGTAGGLRPQRSQRWSNADFGGGIDQSFGAALAAGDFDGDGYTDLAVGQPEAAVGSVGGAGKVRIIFGSSSGLARARNQVWHQDRNEVRGKAEAYDSYGHVLVAANFGGGHQDDLAIGVPGEDRYEGAVHLLYGSTSGLSAHADQLWSQESPGVPGRARADESFGWSLAAGRLTGGSYSDLAVGVPGDYVGHVWDAGAVNIIRGTSAGLTSRKSQRWTQASDGIPGRPESGDAFGLSLAAGSFSGNAVDDLAIGVPFENRHRGIVHIVRGSSSGLTAVGDQVWSQASAGMPGSTESGDTFGYSLGSGNFGHDEHGRFTDLAIRVPGEVVGPQYEAGAIAIIYGTRRGLTSAHSRNLIQRGDGEDEWVVDVNVGHPLIAADVDPRDGHSYDELVTGAYMGDFNSVRVYRGGDSGLAATRIQRWTPKALGHATVWIGFGESLAG